LVQYSEHVAKRIANAGATAYRDIEGRLDGLRARPQEFGVSLFDVSNQDVCFRADMEVHNKLCIRLGKREARRLAASPQETVAQLIAVEGDRRVKIGNAKQMIIELSKWGLICGHASQPLDRLDRPARQRDWPGVREDVRLKS
jgi:hypothetical protein